jgi:multisubunit Na+/H+ antiporter MnhE subunit
MEAYLVFFVLGFLTDKIRLFPFVLGIIIGIVIKTMMENISVDSIPGFGSKLYQKAMDILSHTTTAPPADATDTDDST